MAYTDKFGAFFGRLDNDGNVMILHFEDGALATRLDADVYPLGSWVSARHEHPEGIVLSLADATSLGIEVE